MEKKLNKKISDYISVFKNDIKEKAESIGNSNSEESMKLLQFIYDYERLTITKDDVSKRKRQKTLVPPALRCLGLRSSSVQCSRRRSVSSCYCGTHSKGIPHGSVPVPVPLSSSSSSSSSSLDVSSVSPSISSNANANANADADADALHKVEVSAHDIQGIMYYLGEPNIIYSPEDIHMKKHNPKRIGTFTLVGDKYNITLHS